MSYTLGPPRDADWLERVGTLAGEVSVRHATFESPSHADAICLFRHLWLTDAPLHAQWYFMEDLARAHFIYGFLDAIRPNVPVDNDPIPCYIPNGPGQEVMHPRP